MDREEEIKRLFESVQAVITGSHVVYAKKADGWYHGTDYVNKDALYPNIEVISALCRFAAEDFFNADFETVVSPTVGGVALSQWIAYWNWILFGRKINAVYADEEDVFKKIDLSDITKGQPMEKVSIHGISSGRFEINMDFRSNLATGYTMEKIGTKRVIKRGYDKFVRGKKCLIAEDVLNSGLTVIKTKQAIIDIEGEVIGVSALSNRSGGKVTAETLGVPILKSLMEVAMIMVPEDLCPTCKEKGFESVRTDLGKGKEFLARKGISK